MARCYPFDDFRTKEYIFHQAEYRVIEKGAGAVH